MIDVIKSWFHRYFSDPEAVLLLALLGLGFGLIFFMGHILSPVLISIVVAYLLEWLVKFLQKKGMQRFPAVMLVFVAFMTVFLLLFFVMIPLVWKQMSILFVDLPNMISRAHAPLSELFNRYPEYLSEQQLHTLLATVVQEAKTWGTSLVSASLASIPGLLSWLVYLVLIPLLVFFFLKDSFMLREWLVSFLPDQRGLVSQVSTEVNQQIGNYFRGKMLEILLSWIVSAIIFSLLGLKYAIVLGLVLGLSSLIPYVGVVMGTFPIAIVAYLQWGWNSDLAYVMGSYFGMQAILGNVIEPLLFSEALNLHPVAIILAVLVFGGLWGFWGIFFAIPLATLVKAVLNAWPRQNKPVSKKRHKPITT